MRQRQDDVRPWHYLAPNISTSTPVNCMFVDTETVGIKVEGNPNASIQVLKLWCARWCTLKSGQTRHWNAMHGTTHESFLDLVQSRMDARKPLWLFAHNLGFDLTVLRFWEQLDNGLFTFGDSIGECRLAGYKPKDKGWNGMAVLDDPPTILEVRQRYTKKKLIIVDTYNYFRSSVAKLGESIGVPKLPMPDELASQIQWLEYCARDVFIISEAITKLIGFVAQEDLGRWRYTAPAQAFSAYRHRFMDNKILIHGNKDAIELEREAYYGGRLENHYIGKVEGAEGATRSYYSSDDDRYHESRVGPIYVLDINSCYPAMMLWKMFPCRIFDYVVNPMMIELEEAVRHLCLVARVTINSEKEPFPVHRNGRTFMSLGRYVTSLCGPELVRALRTGSIQNVVCIATYEPADLFSRYVSYFWNLRKEAKEAGDTVKAEWCKLMLNSLGGKFGQRARKWTEVNDIQSPEPWCVWSEQNLVTNKSASYRALSGAVQEECTVGESIDSFPAISAYITSYAREYVNELIAIAGYANTYYVDTDCLHVNDKGYSLLKEAGRIGADELGALSLRGTYASGEYRGLKDYTLDDCSIISGVKANSELVLKGMFRQDKFQRLQSILSGPPPIGVRVDRVTIDRRIGLDPQRIQPDGSVLPQVLHE